MKRWIIGPVALAAAVALGLSGCSSSGQGSSEASGGAGAAQSADGPAPAGAAFVIGAICDCSGFLAPTLGASDKAAIAWANYVNANGGIDGHPVKMIVKDGATDPAKELINAKSLVEESKVKAIIDLTGIGQTYAAYAKSKNVPVLGGCSACEVFSTDPNHFPAGSTLISELTGAVAIAHDAGKKNLGVMYCAESPVCASEVPIMEAAAKALYPDVKITSQKVSGTSPNYTAPCLSFKSSDVDALFISQTASPTSHILADCARQNFKPLNIGLSTSTNNTILKDPNLQGSVATGSNANPYDPSLPEIKTFQTEIQKKNPGILTSDGFSYNALYGWIGGLLFKAAVTAGKLTPSSTSAEVTKALYKIKGDTLGDTSPPVTFTEGKPTFVPCWYTLKVNNGKYETLNDNKPTCLDAGKASALEAATKGILN